MLACTTQTHCDTGPAISPFNWRLVCVALLCITHTHTGLRHDSTASRFILYD